MHVTLRQLSIFEAVARHRSVSRAAAELHLTQPAVSMQLRQIEQQVGLPLLEQVGRRLFLTEAGEELQRHAQRIGAQMLDLKAAMDGLRGLERGQLRLAVVSTANYFVSRLLADFNRRYPGIRVSLQVANREAVIAALSENRTDLAITGQPPDSVDVIAQHFMDNPLVVIAAPTHRLAGAPRIPLSALEREPLVVREPGSGTRAAMERHFAAHNVKYRTVSELSSNEAIKQAVQAGLGLGVVSAQTLELELEAGRLVILPVETFPILRHWYVVHRRHKRLTPAAEALRRMLLATDPHPPLAGGARPGAAASARRRRAARSPAGGPP
jgi:DNA-binding transcriptional LysR family regulator